MEVVVQGVLLGGLYGLFALGLSLMFGVMRLTNIAHGDFIILCAFFALVLSGLGVPVALAILLTLPVAWAAGYAIQRFILNGTLGKDPLPSLVVTFGLAIVTQNFLQEMFSADPRSINSGRLSTLSLQLSENISVGVLPFSSFSWRLPVPLSCKGFSTTQGWAGHFVPSRTTVKLPNSWA